MKFFYFSDREIKELGLAWISLSLAISIVFMWDGGPSLMEVFSYEMLISLVISLPVVGAAFVLHEVGHKLVAQSFGYRAEFRMDKRMLLLALFLAYAGGVVFAAPGAVMVFGNSLSVEENGKISISGPLINLLLGLVIFLPLTLFSGVIGVIGAYGVLINFFLASFNLLPFGVFDGKKVYFWNKGIYLLVFVFSLGVTITSYLFLV